MRRPSLLAVIPLLLACRCAFAAPVHRVTLPNDLRVIVRSNWSTEVVAIELLLDVSCLDEPADKNGIRYLLQQLLLRGSVRLSGDAAAQQLAAVGGVMDATVGMDYVEIYALVPAKGFEVALDLLAQAVRRPALLPAEVASRKAAARQAARAARDDPFQETYLAFRETLYGDHPYARSTFGEPQTLAAISRRDLVDFHAQHYRPNRAVLAICGGVGETRATRATRAAFADWVPKTPPSRCEPQVAPPPCSLIAARELPVSRAHLVLGFLAPAADDPGYYAMQVIDSLLSGGAGGRLPQRIREELGLVYHVSSFYPTLSTESHFAVYAATGPRYLPAVKSALVEALAELSEKMVSPGELTHAKRYLLGSYALSHQRMKDQAYALAWYGILGLESGFEDRYREAIQAVTAADVQRAAQAVLGRFVLAVTMPTA